MTPMTPMIRPTPIMTEPLRWILIVLVAGTLAACMPDDETAEIDTPGNDSIAGNAGDVIEDTPEATWDVIDAQLTTLEDRLDELRTEIDEAGESAEVEWEEQIAELEARTENLRAEMDQMGDDANAAWNDFADRAGDTMESISDGIEEIGDDIESSLG